MSTTVRLRLLGTPRTVYAEGGEPELPLGKPLAALCFVALEGPRVTREDLGRVLWPEASAKRARASVRQALWLIRKELGSDAVLEVDGELLPGNRLRTDLDSFASELAAGHLEAAWDRWSGGPLHGFSVPDAPRWNAWADGVRLAWERRFGDALEAYAATRRSPERVQWLERAMEVRPYREGIHAQLVEALLHQRRLEDAEAALHRARSVVDRPTPGLFDDLEQRIQALRREAFEPEHADGFGFEFVGRAGEFSRLAGLWRTVRSGRMRLGGVVGPAGIGKTRLVDQLVELAEGEGGAVVEAKGVDSDRAVPLGVVASLAKQLLRLPGAAGISSGSAHALHTLLPSVDRHGAPAAGPGPGTAALGDALADLVSAVADEAPLVVRVEDLHWVDRSSAALLLRMTRSLHRVPAFVLMTCRTEERDVTALRGLRRLEQSGDALLVSLGPLTRSEVAELLALSFTFDCQATVERSARRLHEASGGNPLFLLELLRHLEERGLVRGDLQTTDGDWAAPVLDLPEVLELPGSIREILERRLGGLGDDALLLAALLADSDRQVSVPELGRRARMSAGRVTRGVAELLRRDVAVWTRQDGLLVAHDTLRGSLRGRATSRESSGSRRWASWVAGVAAVAALLALLVGRPGMASAGAAFGGGVLVSNQRPHLVTHRITPETDGSLLLDPMDSLRVPPRFQVVAAPARLASGVWALPAIRAEGPDRAPDAWVVEDGVPTELWAEEGDDRVSAIGPVPGQYLVGSQADDTTRFRMDLYHLDANTGSRTLLGRGMAKPTWSRDGSLVLASIEAARDSVVALRPDGLRLHTVAAPDGRLTYLGWCDGRSTALLLSLPRGEAARAWSWRPGEERPRPLPLRYPASWLECSPDGGAVAYAGWVERELRLVVEELDGQGVWVHPRPLGMTRFHWVDATPPEAPRSVRIDPDSVRLQRGERRRLRAVVDGVSELAPGRASWSSSDPLTVAVSDAGELIGNGPGRALVRYTVDGWLADSVEVRVTQPSSDSEVLFSDPLERLDEEVWRVDGYPAPSAARDDEGRHVLSMNGDGRFTDGVVTHRAFELTRGATAELDFHLPLTRIDRQQVSLCLLRGRPLPRGPRLGAAGSWDERICFRWPADELEDFDPGEASVQASGPPLGPVSVAGLVREGEWNRVSLQLHPDGRLSAYLNGAHVHTLSWRLELEGKRWHVGVRGRAADTRLLVRNATLWGGPRYPVGSEQP